MPKDYLEGVDLNKIETYQAVGCKECGNIGYKGRMGIFEVWPMDGALEELIFSKDPAHKIYEEALKSGVISMIQFFVLNTMEELLTE